MLSITLVGRRGKVLTSCGALGLLDTPRDVGSSKYLLSEADMLEWVLIEQKNINRE